MGIGDVDLPADPEELGDRIVIRLEPGGPIELTGLTDSFAALARLYARHYRSDNNPESAPRLFVTRLESGSIIAEIAPLVSMFGQPLYQMVVAANTVAGFTKRLNDGLKAFAGIDGAKPPLLPDHADASDLREFVKPLTGRKNAALGIKHARYRKSDGQKEILVEYTFDETEINRATVNIERALELPQMPIAIEPPLRSAIKNEVMMVFEKASRSPGKEKGRPTDWTVISDVTDKALPTYFRKSVRGNLKELMVRGDTNPLNDFGFIVDVHVQYKEGEP
ncbi:MAG TPA: hypothetical protein VHC39_05990, partial [Rhizomicrobium sp.]|nr:hypothetical protein [Rhizomicrobium sp.]